GQGPEEIEQGNPQAQGRKAQDQRLAADPEDGLGQGPGEHAEQLILQILVDGDACPVKDEIYRVAGRHQVPVSVVSNSPFRVPVGPLVERVVVPGNFDAADDWSAERASPGTVVVTADILLADRCLKAGATVLG